MSNLVLVTESLTFIAGTDSLPVLDSWYSRCTPVTLSSTMPAQQNHVKSREGMNSVKKFGTTVGTRLGTPWGSTGYTVGLGTPTKLSRIIFKHSVSGPVDPQWTPQWTPRGSLGVHGPCKRKQPGGTSGDFFIKDLVSRPVDPCGPPVDPWGVHGLCVE